MFRCELFNAGGSPTKDLPAGVWGSQFVVWGHRRGRESGLRGQMRAQTPASAAAAGAHYLGSVWAPTEARMLLNNGIEGL